MFFFSPAVALPGVEDALPDAGLPEGKVELLDPAPPGGEDELLASAPPSGSVAKIGLLGALSDRSGMDESATSMTSEADPPPWDSMASISRKTASSSPSSLIVNLEPSKNLTAETTGISIINKYAI